ncbi:MAG: arginine repressor [Candidatus Dormiibacterota bacterium]
MSATSARSVSSAAKPARHRAILELVRSGAIRTQEDLVAELHRRRFAVTQATVSRDIRELGLLRVYHGEAGARYVIPMAELDSGRATERLRNALDEHVQSIEFVDLLGIIHTNPGCAPLVAAALDGSRFEEVAGTIAGDDTVLVITRSRPAAQRLLRKLTSIPEQGL